MLSNFRTISKHFHPLPRAQAKTDKLLCISVLVGRLFLVHSFHKGASTGGSSLTRYGGRFQVELLAHSSILSAHIGVKTPSILFLILLKVQLYCSELERYLLIFVKFWGSSIPFFISTAMHLKESVLYFTQHC